MEVSALIAALYHHTDLHSRFPQLADNLAKPQSIRKSPGGVPPSDDLKAALRQFVGRDEAISSPELFRVLLGSDAGQQALAEIGVADETVEQILTGLTPTTNWRDSSQRREALEALKSFGRFLTAESPPDRGRSELEGPLEALAMTLSKMKRRNAIVIGYPGTGKTALIYELARRIVSGHASIPKRLHDCDIFELSPTFLRSGASVVGQYEERIKALIEVLRANPNIILFIDEIHSMFSSGMHGRGPFTEANESFKGVLSRGEIMCIGCTTLAEYKHYIEPDKALQRRFGVIRVQPPTRETTLRILQSRRPRVEKHYAPLRVPDDVLHEVVKLAEDYMPARYEPDRSIQLLDQACAWMTITHPESTALTREALMKALEHTLGHPVVRPEKLSEEGVFQKLQAKIKGQDDVLHEVAKAFVTGLGNWRGGSGPRGVYLFGGPTGVGKTEVAMQLGRILGGERESLIRVDCNLLSGAGRDGGPTRNLLLGVPPGYIGYARGQGGLLTRVRDEPETVILFDEFEKADPSVGELLLNIIDEGKAEDSDGNQLDFRRTFLIFTTNAGAAYDDGQLGFLAGGDGAVPTVDRQDMEQDLMGRLGIGPEFLGRLSHVFLFKGLTHDVIEQIVDQQLQRLSELAELRGKRMTWENDVAQHLAQRWQPRFGVRFLTAILRNRIVEQLGMAEAAGQLEKVKNIRLRSSHVQPEAAGVATRTVEGDTLYINIA